MRIAEIFFTIFLMAMLILPVIADETASQTGTGTAPGEAQVTSTVANTPNAHRKLAEEFMAAEEFEKAVDEYTMAIELAPDDFTLYFDRALAYRKSRQVDKALDDYKKVVELNPKFEKGYFELAEIYRRTDSFDSALLYYNKLIDLNPENSSGYYGRAMLYYYNEHFEPATFDLEKAKTLDPTLSAADGYIMLAKGNIPGSHQSAADFKVKTINSDELSLGQFKGKKAVIIDQWATWCPPCRAEMPELMKFYKMYSEKIEIIGASRDKEIAPVEEFIKTNDIRFTIVHDSDNTIKNLYPCDYIPFLVVINTDGEIVKTFIGYDEGLLGKLEEILGLGSVFKPSKENDEKEG